MYLKDFDFDLLYEYTDDEIIPLMETENISYDEARILNYQRSFKEVRRKFTLQTRCITSMFSRLFPKMQTKDFWKITIVCCTTSSCEEIMNIGNVVEVRINFDYKHFLQQDNITKKKVVLELLMNGINQVVDKYELDLEPFLSTQQKIIQSQYQNKWIWKAKWDLSRKFQAKVLCVHDIHQISLYMIVYNKANVVLSKDLILTELPDEWDYANYLGELCWLNKDSVALLSKDKEIVFKKEIA